MVKPNITNVVRPIVKVVVTPPTPTPEPEPDPEIETVVEEPEVEVEAEEELVPLVIADVEAELAPDGEEEAEEIEEVIVEEIEIEEEPTVVEAVEEIIEEDEIIDGVEVIDVVTSEGSESKTCIYDPDGNSVEEGDVVLVPARDSATDRDVVREAEVARGNYKVAPESIETPLQKIIGVVRRRAEKVFVAMITPDEEENKVEETKEDLE